MTTREIIAISRKKLLETTTEILDDSTILIYANLAYDDIRRRIFTNDQILTATVSLTAGVGTLPSNFGTMYGDAYTNDNRFFGELSIDDFNRKTTSQSVTIEGGNLKVYPTNITSINIKFFPSYASLTDSVNPTINSYFHELIVYGIMHRAHEDLQDEALSKYYFDKYEADLQRKASIQSNYEEDNQRSSQMFSEQTLISDAGTFSNSPNHF